MLGHFVTDESHAVGGLGSGCREQSVGSGGGNTARHNVTKHGLATFYTHPEFQLAV